MSTLSCYSNTIWPNIHSIHCTPVGIQFRRQRSKMKRTLHEELLLGNSLYNAQDTPLVKVVYLSRKHSLPSETVRTASRYSGINSSYTTPPSFPSRIKSTPESKSRSIVQEQWRTKKYALWHIPNTSILIFSTRTTNMSTQLCSCNYLTITYMSGVGKTNICVA